jgi:hypothetical protein
MLLAGKARVRVPMRSLIFFKFSNHPNRTVALGFTHSLYQKSFWGKERPARKVNKLTAIYELTV